MTKFLERAAPVTTIAGFGFYLLAFLSLGILPWWMTNRVAPVKSGGEFERLFLPKEVPAALRETYPDLSAYARGLVRGRDVYIAEGCWHCHTQYVRPVRDEAVRYGAVSENWEYQNEMNLPQLFGTRRVGPDLLREHDKHDLDWHLAHFRDPRAVVPESVMPRYDWFFDAGGKPNERGWAVTAYVMWLGSWRVGAAERPQ